MQSSLIRVPRRSLACLTLCAISAPAPAAWGQSRPFFDLTSLFDSLTEHEERDAAFSEPEVTAAQQDDEERTGAPAASAATEPSSDFPAVMTTPIALTLGADQRRFASISLATLPPLATTASSTEATAAAPTPGADDDGSGLRTAGFVAGGVGLAGMALFAIAGLGAKSAYDKLDSDCGNAPCMDEAHRSDIEGGRMLQTTANIGLAAGLTGLGVGATLLVLGSRSSVEKRGPSASVSPSGGMITYGGRF